MRNNDIFWMLGIRYSDGKEPITSEMANLEQFYCSAKRYLSLNSFPNANC
jgi:hypothetical protein